MRRWAAGIEYDGTAYRGWQRHAHIDSVQARVEDALSRVAAEGISVVASGRTDAGVHAAQQVVHFDSGAERSADAWRMGGNRLLPRDIALRWVTAVDGDFHARYSAASRQYRYVILHAQARPALWAHRCLWTPRALEADCMHRAAQSLVGEHDFSAFRAAECQSPTPVRRLLSLTVLRQGDFLCVDVHGNAFLHHMVRNIVGSLLKIGLGERPEHWMHSLLEGRDRRLAAATAAARGLYLLGAHYPDFPDIPGPASLPFP